MEGLEEKKWFIYVKDHPEGPFSFQDLQTKVAAKHLDSSQYAWCDGMPDWNPIPEISTLQPLFMTTPAPTEPPTPIDPEPVAADTPVIVMPALEEVSSPNLVLAEPIKESEPESSQVVQAPLEITPEPEPKTEIKTPPTAPIRPKKRIFAIGVLIAAALAVLFISTSPTPMAQAVSRFFGDYARPWTRPLVLRFPALSRFLSPLPHIETIDAGDFDELQSAVLIDLKSVGPKFAIGLEKGHLESPTFYVSSNLPNGTALDLYIEGIPETLLTEGGFIAKASAELQEGLAHFPPPKNEQGLPIPRGEFQVYITMPGTLSQELSATPLSAGPPPTVLPKDARLLAKKMVFLGGAQDGVYLARLREIHEKLRARAKTELEEIQQFEKVLISQLQSTVTQFGETKKLRGRAAQLKSWQTFSEEWTRLVKSVEESVSQKISGASASSDFVYFSIFQEMAAATTTVKNFHLAQAQVLAGKTKPADLVSLAALAESTLNHLRNRTQFAREDLNKSNLPPREREATAPLATSETSRGTQTESASGE